MASSAHGVVKSAPKPANSFEQVELANQTLDDAVLATTKRISLDAMPRFGKRKKIAATPAVATVSAGAQSAPSKPKTSTMSFEVELSSQPARSESAASTSAPSAAVGRAIYANDPDDSEEDPSYPGYSKALTDYVQRVFKEAHKRPGCMPKVEAHLEKLFLDAQRQKLERKRRYWESLPLPDCVSSVSANEDKLRGRGSAGANPSSTGVIYRSGLGRTGESSDRSRTSSWRDANPQANPVEAPSSRMHTQNSLDGHKVQNAENSASWGLQSGPSASAFGRASLDYLNENSGAGGYQRVGGNVSDEEARKRMRAARFEQMQHEDRSMKREMAIKRAHAERIQAAVRAMGAEGNPDVLEWDIHTIVGSNQGLEKSYLRLTAPPDPSTVRPLHVLEQALDFLKRKWLDERNYTYICDQFKSLRQDLTVQRICNPFTVQVYEAHARIALEMGDLGEYNQCQSQLKQLYGRGLPGCVDEFTAYRILYYIHTRNRPDLNALVAYEAVKSDIGPYTRYALQVRWAVAAGDYHSFFALYQRRLPILSAYLLDQFVERERLRACRTICRAYRPTIPVEMLAKELGFYAWDPVETERVTRAALMKSDNGVAIEGARLQHEVRQVYLILADKGLKTCTEWLEELGISLSKDKAELNTKESMKLFEIKYESTTTKVDIKGQIH